MTHYGRPKPTEHCQTDRQEAHTAAGRILALGGAMIAGFLAAMCIPWGSGMAELPENMVPEGAVAVMSTAVSDRETVSSAAPSRQENAADTGVEPFGYLDGEWNIWEYIGDLMWSLLS